MEANPLEIAKIWANNPYFDEASRMEIQKLIDNNDEKEITERFYKDLEFGTGGLRAILGMGSNRMSKYSVRKATQALINSVKESFPNEKELSICIGYDSRKFSKEFAKEVASVSAGNNVKAYIFDRLNPVALVSWAVRHHNSKAGVMITASHNPPEYNGYKAYWADGAQVTPPYDQMVISNYNAIKEFSEISYQDFEQGIKENKIQWIGEEVEDAYYQVLMDHVLDADFCKNNGEQLKIVFTPIHGTGLLPVTTILNKMGLTNVSVVEEQKNPDSSFPTVKSPNPENPSAMAMATKQMKAENADLAYGTDPDTDRLGVVVNRPDGEVFLTGNQIGLLMLHYILENLKSNNKLPEKSYVVKSIVTSKLMDVLTEHYGVKMEETLTGFKWICAKMLEYDNKHPDYKFLFATEESFGYMGHNKVRDKDGPNAVALMSEVALYHKVKNGHDLVEALDVIYEKFGFSSEELLCLDYFGKEGAEKIQRIMEAFRKYQSTEMVGEEIDFVDDFKSSERKFTSGKNETIQMTKSNVIAFGMKSGNILYLRPSGTEPKIKFYIMVQEKQGSLEEKKAKAREKTESYLRFIKDFCEKA